MDREGNVRTRTKGPRRGDKYPLGDRRQGGRGSGTVGFRQRALNKRAMDMPRVDVATIRAVSYSYGGEDIEDYLMNKYDGNLADIVDAYPDIGDAVEAEIVRQRSEAHWGVDTDGEGIDLEDGKRDYQETDIDWMDMRVMLERTEIHGVLNDDPEALAEMRKQVGDEIFARKVGEALEPEIEALRKAGWESSDIMNRLDERYSGVLSDDEMSSALDESSV